MTQAATEGGEREKSVLLVMVSIQPRCYGEAIGRAIAELSPHRSVRIVEAEDLAERVRRLDADVVLCSQPRPGAFAREDGGAGPLWVEYYPYAEPPEEELRVDGRATAKRALELKDLISIVDEACARMPRRRTKPRRTS